MYAYTHDARTGGLLLNSSPSKLSKEPRPVYAPELDVLGFDRYWSYEKQCDTPYMWAEANHYIYRGKLIAMLKGGNVYQVPEILLAYECKEWRETPNGKAIEKVVCESPDNGNIFIDKHGNVFTLVLSEQSDKILRPIDISAMVEANRDLLQRVTDSTAKKIIAVYEKYADKLDIFHVAFSGGKDSCVLLDLVKKTLPHKSFVVMFGDTMMEFPDTYDVVDATEKMCKKEDIPFYRAKSHLTPEQSWELFGPPSRTQRWCCSVHKSTPQALLLRSITHKVDNKALAFVGVRSEESLTRSEYEFYDNKTNSVIVTSGKKIRGQIDYYPILDWTSAEIYIYCYANQIELNRAYILGNSRVGCMVCPMSSQKSQYLSHVSYREAEQRLFKLIRKTSDKVFTDEAFNEFMENGAWKTRSDGRYIVATKCEFNDETIDGKIRIAVSYPSTNWQEWIKTLGEITRQNNIFTLTLKDRKYQFRVDVTEAGYVVTAQESDFISNPVLRKHLKNTFRKAAYCVGCGVCVSQCPFGCISIIDGIVEVSNKCRHCNECNKTENGCLRAGSLKLPKGGTKMERQSINCYSTHAPQKDWIDSFFTLKEEFRDMHGLGPEQILRFTKFLRHAGLITERGFELTPLFYALEPIRSSDAFWGILLVNLAHTPEFGWYIRYIENNKTISRDELETRLADFESSKTVRSHITRSFGRILELPFGTHLGLGEYNTKGKTIISFTRHYWTNPDPRVILYGLYVYNEKANAHYEFRLNSLYENLEQDGIPPTQIFGLDRQTMIPLLNGLTANYNDYINATFTNDLDKISLMEYRSSSDVLKLFEEGK